MGPLGERTGKLYVDFPMQGKETEETEETKETQESNEPLRYGTVSLSLGFLGLFGLVGFLPAMPLADLALIALAAFSILLLITFLGSLCVLVPYVPTPMPIVRRMVELAGLRGDEVVVDLGCGDARLLLEAKRRFPGIRAIGYELPLGIYLLAKLRVLLAGRRVEVRMRDFWGADLRDADVVFLYLFPDICKRLEAKLQRELKVGARVISHGFPLGTREPRTVERFPLFSWRLFHGPDKPGPRIFVYEWERRRNNTA